MGRKYGDEKEQCYADADIFVFPTYNEAFGLVLLEAMSHKLPIVTTNEGSIPDIVTDGVNGLISERLNPQSLAGCIESLLNKPEVWKKMGDARRKRLEEQFTEEVFEKRMKEVLESSLIA